LQENGISYQMVLPSFPGEVVSPNGMLVARGDGIYIVSTGEKLLKVFMQVVFLAPTAESIIRHVAGSMMGAGSFIPSS
jgi:hypothetical protein